VRNCHRKRYWATDIRRVVVANKTWKILRDILVHSRLGPTNSRTPRKIRGTFVRGRDRTVHRVTLAIPLH